VNQWEPMALKRPVLSMGEKRKSINKKSGEDILTK
jgi:hypothetical protein